MRNVVYVLTACCVVLFSCCSRESQPLRVLQLNTWGEGSVVSGGTQALIDIIDQSDPDLVLLQEIRGQKTIDLFIDSLQKRGKTYYGKSMNISTALMSKYPMNDVRSSTELGDDSYAFMKGVVEVKSQRISFYSIHLDWLHVGYYLARGYSSNPTWNKLSAPVTDADSVLNYNRQSRRNKEIEALMASVENDIDNGSLVIFGGDLNEPSHLDWQEDTKDIRDHNGMVIDWDCSSMLYNAGYKDVYRESYPSAVTHPGFTCNAGNKYVDAQKLLWSLNIDDRERIDFIYYHPNESLELESVSIIGPKEDFYDGKIQYQETQDNITETSGVWPSDHKGNLAIFKLYVED